MAKLRIRNLDYKVTKNNKVVTCYINAILFIQDKPIEEINATGNAVLHFNDSFNEITGRRLAESRAKKMLFRLAKESLAAKEKEIKKLYDELATGTAKYKGAQIHEKNHLKYMLDNL